MKRTKFKIFFLLSTILLLTFTQLSSTLPTAAKTTSKQVKCRAFYTIRPGDSLNSIARTYNITVDKLIKANKLSQPLTIYVFQVLCIPSKSQPYSTPVPKNSYRLAADFIVIRRDNVLLITTTNFPRYSMYAVKLSSSLQPGNFKKLGFLKTGKYSDDTYKIIIPNKLRRTQNMQVCLKNFSTDANICRKVQP